MDRHMNAMLQQCWLESHMSESVQETHQPQICQPVATFNDLPGMPQLIDVCTNTSGFVRDKFGCVVRAKSATANCTPLLTPCILLTFYSPNGERKNDPEIDYIHVLTQGQNCKIRCATKLTDLNGFHCDSQRQSLYIAAHSTVTFADLSGKIIRVLASNSITQLNRSISCMSSNSDKLFILTYAEQVLFVDKDSGNFESVINVSASNSTYLNSVAVSNGKIFLTDADNRRFLVYCSISGQLVKSFTTALTFSKCLHGLWGLALDSRSLIYVSDSQSTVSVLGYFGNILQTLGTENQSQADDDTESFSTPGSVLLVEHAESRTLFVSDEDYERLRVFNVD